MTLTQTVEIPANRRLHLDLEVPSEVPTGRANVVIQFPVATGKPNETSYIDLSEEDAISLTAEVIEKYRPALEDLAK